jgi:hypothetical protein
MNSKLVQQQARKAKLARALKANVKRRKIGAAASAKSQPPAPISDDPPKSQVKD